MYHYNFTNDLRISNLESTLRDAANAFLTDSVPSASEDKSKNNNFMTVGFYFNLKAKGKCAKLAARGYVKKVVLNFIRKFQFPNMRTGSDYESAISDGIKLAPMRVIVKLLNALFLIDKKQAYLTKDEIKNFIFFNSNVAKTENPNIIETALQLLSYRNNEVLPSNISTNETEHFWNQPDRQIREMVKTLRWTGCFSDDDDKIKFDANDISRDLKADLFEIINYDSFWKGRTVDDWQKYMDEGLELENEGLDTIDSVDENEFLPENLPPLTRSDLKYAQIIYYGVPGCGKSHEVNKNIKSICDYNKIRTVFHPEYTNADFVGQILPEVNVNTEGRSIVEYKFKPGPFTEIVRRAYLNPDENFYLVIEEINRGNAAAIFGDMFQLLDRLDENENPSEISSDHVYGKGWSSYGVDNQDVNAYIRNQIIFSQEKNEHCTNAKGAGQDSNPRCYKYVDISSENENVLWRKKDENGLTIVSDHLHFTTNTAIRLPPNLSIYATMNTSDQNVFTLDNAFQRRWEMKQISNKLDEKEKKLDGTPGDQQVQYNKIIGNTDVKWGDFREKINEIIMQSAEENGLSSMEDKRLGGWFITPKKAVDADKDALPEITTQAFAEKVLKYLWDDAFKFDRKSHFADGDKSFKTLEDLIDSFKEKGFKVFKNETIKDLQVKTSLKSPTESDGDVNSNGQSNT